MRKAILVIDMPDSCYDCCLHNYHFCDVTNDLIEEYLNTEYRPDWCPLKPMPERDDREYFSEFARAYRHGWNDAIKAIDIR